MSYNRVKKEEINSEFLTADEKYYFIKKPNNINYGNIDFSLKAHIFPIDDELVKLSKRALSYHGWIAGGSVASSIIDEFDKANDIDIFAISLDGYNEIIKNLIRLNYDIPLDKLDKLEKNPSEVMVIDAVPGKNCEFKKRVQVIKMVWYTSVYELLESFDLLHVKFAMSNNNLLFYHHSAQRALKEKHIVVTNTMFPVSLFKRIEKYCERGFTMFDGKKEDLFKSTKTNFADKTDLIIEKEEVEFSFEEQNSLWGIPEYRQDYYLLTPQQLSRKWNGRKTS